jgi:mannose-6-phosphate isomerase-like protein (cupin superfamily)
MHRLTLLIVLGCLFLFAVVLAQRSPPAKAYVTGWNQGEILNDARGRTTAIYVSPAQGASDMSFMSQDMPRGSGILVHRHDRTEETLFVHEGSGTFILGDQRIHVEKGSTIYVPRETWHGMENPDSDVRLVFVVTPPGLEGFFRGMFWEPGKAPKQLSPEEISVLEKQYDSVARQQ